MSLPSLGGRTRVSLACRQHAPVTAAFCLLAISAIPAPAYAHHPGGGGSVGVAGPINTIPGTTLDQGQLVAGISYELNAFNSISDRALAWYASQHQHVHTLRTIQSPALSLSYGVSPDLTIGARLPYVLRTDIREGDHSHSGGVALNEALHRGDADGIGDIAFLGQYRFLNSPATGTQWALLAGFKAPTGRTNVHDRNGELFDAEFQPGSGGWDWTTGLAVSQGLGGRASLHANILYTWTGTGEQDTSLGNRFQYNLALAYRAFGAAIEPGRPLSRMNAGVLPAPMYHGAGRNEDYHHDAPERSHGLTLDLVLELNGEWHERETVGGLPDNNSGGNVVYLSPGARVSVEKWSSFVSFGVPIINNMYGLQAEPDYRLTGGIAVSF
jgi:outer membrane putative beta-barrel porin/alpha-amylase